MSKQDSKTDLFETCQQVWCDSSTSNDNITKTTEIVENVVGFFSLLIEWEERSNE